MQRGARRPTGSLGAVLASAATVLGATVLAVDDALGFAGLRFLGAAAAPLAVGTAVIAAVSVVLAVRAHDVGRALLAGAAGVFALWLNSALLNQLAAPVGNAVQTVFPIVVVVAAVSLARRAPRPVTVLGLVTALLAAVWLAMVFVPFGLAGFVVLQAVTLGSATVLTAIPLLGPVVDIARRGWDSAAVR